MTTAVRMVAGWFAWVNWWGWPFLWILLIPMVTMPLQVERVGSMVWDNCVQEPGIPGAKNTWQCPVEDVLPTLWPGLLNLVVFLWLLSPRPRSRHAAAVAGSLGAARLVVPGLIYVVLGSPLTLRTQYWPGPDESAIASVVLWSVSLAAALTFPSLVRAERQPQAG